MGIGALSSFFDGTFEQDPEYMSLEEIVRELFKFSD